jgi:lipoprotein-anchoring transpeptidase ErfK/SrfK
MLSLFFWLSLAPEKTVVVDLKNFQYFAMQNYQIIHIGKASGGRRWCPDIHRSCKTPFGTFKLITKKGRWYRSTIYPVGCRGKKCAPMPWAVRFKYTGASIHGANDNWSSLKLKHRSHGCVHVEIKDAKWLHDFVDSKTVIVVLPY